MLSHAVNHRANTLQVWVPAATARIIRVTDHIAKTRPFAAKLTSHGHKYSSPHRQNSHKAKSLAKFRLLRTLFVDFTVCGKSHDAAMETESRQRQGKHHGKGTFQKRFDTDGLLLLSYRQAKQLWRRYCRGGTAGLKHSVGRRDDGRSRTPAVCPHCPARLPVCGNWISCLKEIGCTMGLLSGGAL